MNQKAKIQKIIDNAEVFKPIQETDEQSKKRHPLDNILDLDFKPKAPEWLLDGVVQVGVVTVAGMRGVGKTTSLLPLAAAVAHLCPDDYPLRPKIRRHVCWITEDVGQAERVLSALVTHGGWANFDEVRQWVHIIPAIRLEPGVIASAATIFADRFTVIQQGVNGPFEVKPLVVFDTSNACLEIENESDNSQVGQAMAMLKQAFNGFPVLIINHVSKSLNGSNDVKDMTSRGASAWESDAVQCLYLVVEEKGLNGDGQRLLLLGKRRFESDVEGLRFESHTTEENVISNTGEETVRMRYSIAQPMEFGARAKAKVEQAQTEHSQRMTSRRTEALDITTSKRKDGNPISSTTLRNLMGGKVDERRLAIESLITESWLIPIDVPPAIRQNNSKKTFLIALTDAERRGYLEDGVLPAEKAEIPQTWRKKVEPETSDSGMTRENAQNTLESGSKGDANEGV